ncbi:MAG: YeeE/YedE family protein [Burkholderiales bacterium]
MAATEFTPIASLAGGALIGASAVALMLFQGRIAGVSGIAVRLLVKDGERGGRLAFLLGLVVAPIVYWLVIGTAAAQSIEAGPVVLVVAGLLVGFGSVWGNGCTSGHGVCGLSRLSLRSLVATLVFMGTGIVTVFVMRHWL